MWSSACHDPTSAPNAGGLRQHWYQAQNGMSRARPLVSSDVVYFGTGTGEVVAREFETGIPRWSTQVITQSEIAGNNMLLRSGAVIAAGVWEVGAVDAMSGLHLWNYRTPLDTVDTEGAPVGPGILTRHELDADDARVYVPAWGASVSAVDIRTGLAVWIWEPGRASTDTAGNIFRSGAEGTRVSGDTVFVTVWHWLDRVGLTSEDWLVLLDRLSGRELARVTIPGTGGATLFGSPEVHGNHVILTTSLGRVWAIDRSSLNVAWHFVPPARFGTFTHAELHGDALYLDGGDESLYAISAIDGSVIWKASAGGATRDLLVTDTRVYYPTQALLKVFDRRTGTFVAQASLRSFNEIWQTPPASARSRVFIGITPAALSFDEP